MLIKSLARYFIMFVCYLVFRYLFPKVNWLLLLIIVLVSVEIVYRMITWLVNRA